MSAAHIVLNRRYDISSSGYKRIFEKMEPTDKVESRRQHLLGKATKYNKKSVRLLKKVEREIRNRRPNMAKINNWKEKSAKYVNKGLRYMNKIDALDQENNDRTKEISFNMEKVCEILSLADNLCKRFLFRALE